MEQRGISSSGPRKRPDLFGNQPGKSQLLCCLLKVEISTTNPAGGDPAGDLLFLPDGQAGKCGPDVSLPPACVCVRAGVTIVHRARSPCHLEPKTHVYMLTQTFVAVCWCPGISLQLGFK